ncbi:hypothetical protein AEQ67_18160 [Pseudomonas sp. RIT-PI-q]|nr:hypothetical protein AEQ67_18160 [Pseudomonas sp. RIT-PI-q]
MRQGAKNNVIKTCISIGAEARPVHGIAGAVTVLKKRVENEGDRARIYLRLSYVNKKHLIMII